MHYLLEGLKTAWSNKKMLALFYVVNLFFGVIVMIPFRSLLMSFAGQSLAGKSLADHFDLEFLYEFMNNAHGAVPAMMSLFLVAGIAYWLTGLFLSGGAYGIYISGGHFTGQRFWTYAGQYFGRFCRLFMWSLPVFVIFYALQFVETGIVRMIFGKDPYQYIVFWGNALRTALGYIGILLYYLVLDYARIYLVRTGETKSRKALWHGLKFMASHLASTFSLSLVIYLLGVAALLIYYPLGIVLHVPNTLIAILLLAVQQCYILLRMFLRLSLYAAQTALHKGRFTAELPLAQVQGNTNGDLAPAVGT